MSQVTSVILTTAAGETQINALNSAWDWGYEECPRFRDRSAASAGSKHMECNVYMAGFNHLDLAAFIAAVESVGWEHPGSVQLFVLGDNDDRFTEIGLWERGK